jgi:(4-(4-[2-(gamma-L-glutamylamino)ethyl]phenoxymethyl)furan-2-yl)methanamine synthase
LAKTTLSAILIVDGGGTVTTIVGWDIGGANVKAAWLDSERGETQTVRVASYPFEIWRDKDRLPKVLQSVLSEVAAELPQVMALTMTAELADIFSTKREGVLFVLENVLAAFPDCKAYALDLSGDFVALKEAQTQPLDFAAANWLATALYLAREYSDCLLVDVGSTTTDIIPILGGQVANQGRTDLARLLAGELVYTGVLRTHLASIVHSVPVGGRFCPVASEYFAISGDVHLILGHLGPEDYTCPTPDGQPPTLASARGRLARLVCADTEMLSPAEIDEMARYVHQRQVQQISEALQQVLSRLAGHRELEVVTMGSGAFLATQAVQQLGLRSLNSRWDRQVSAVAPCLAVAHLLAEQMEARGQ